MMRWIVGSSLKFRFVVVAAAARHDGLRRAAAARHAGGRLPGVRAAARRDPDALPRIDRHGGRSSSSARRSSSRSTASTGCDVIRSKSVPQLSSIELLFEPGTDILHARQLVQERVDGGHAVPADLGGAAGHHAGDVDDRARREDRRLLEDDVDPAPLDDRLLEDQGAAAANSGRRQRRRSGASTWSSTTC